MAGMFSIITDKQFKMEMGASWLVFFIDMAESFTEVEWLK